MNTHDCAKHTHAGPQWVTNTHEAHTMGSSGKLFPTESPHSLECESQRKPRPGVLLAQAHKAPCGFPHAGTALASLGAEPPWYPRGPSTGPELCADGSSHPGFQQVHHTFVELCRATHLPSRTAQWDFFLMVELTSFFSWNVTQGGTYFWNLHLFSPVFWLLFLSGSCQASRSFTGPSEGLPQTNPETF